MEVEEEFKKMLNDVEALKRSLTDSSHQDHISKLQQRVEHLANLAKSETPRRPIANVVVKESQLQTSKYYGRGNRARSYSLQEDEAICRAWLAIGDNSAVATDQKSFTMWDRILQVFNSLMGHATDRNANGLQCRWQHIQWSCTKFCEFVMEMDKLNPSGTTSNDSINLAKAKYNAVLKGQFKSESCWLILKDTPKWNEHLLNRTTKKAKPTLEVDRNGFAIYGYSKVDTPPPSAPTTPASVSHDSEVDPFVLDQVRMARVDEGTEVKENKKKGNEHETAIMQEFMITVQRTLENHHQVACKRLELKEKRVKERKYETDVQIMGKDLSGLNDMQQAFFVAQQKEIWDRWVRERRVPSAPTCGGSGESSGG